MKMVKVGLVSIIIFGLAFSLSGFSFAGTLQQELVEQSAVEQVMKQELTRQFHGMITE